jgi:hypothetical protein
LGSWVKWGIHAVEVFVIPTGVYER